ncbi:hypothetical protein [Shewanella indica]|uniref:hypothetical protein n=1 Tax=Shewanella indica TaxID=768528 RepID=UPI001CFD5708|nr:hypothetical protein [Shewanella indica]
MGRVCHQYRSLSRIYHPNVERVLAFGELGGSDRVFIAMAWERGVALDCTEIIAATGDRLV